MPEPGPLDVLVEIAAVGVCGSDVHYYEHGRIGTVRRPRAARARPRERGPRRRRRRPRHEARAGDRVTLEPGLPCGRCRECRTGHYNLCRDVRFLGAPPTDGAFTRYVAIHEDFAHALPDGLSDEAGRADGAAVGRAVGVREGGVTAGDRVLVTGAGPIGLLAAQVARARGDRDRGDRRQPAPARARARTGAHARDAGTSRRGRRADRVLGPPAGAARRHRGAAPGRRRRARRHGRRTRRRACRSRSSRAARSGSPAPSATRAPTRPRSRWPPPGRVDLEAIVTGHFALDEVDAALRAGREDPAA